MDRERIEVLRRQGYLDDETANLMLNDLGQQLEGIPVEQRRSVAVAVARGPGRVARRRGRVAQGRRPVVRPRRRVARRQGLGPPLREVR